MKPRSMCSGLLALPAAVLLAAALLPASLLAQSPAPDAAPAAGERVSVDGGSYWNITVPELQAMMEAGDPLLVNVHVPFDGDIAGTDFSIPYDQITDQLDRLPADKSAPVVLYCRSGNMSVAASTALAQLGYTRIYNLVGGFRAWSAAGLPMEPTR